MAACYNYLPVWEDDGAGETSGVVCGRQGFDLCWLVDFSDCDLKCSGECVAIGLALASSGAEYFACYGVEHDIDAAHGIVLWISCSSSYNASS